MGFHEEEEEEEEKIVVQVCILIELGALIAQAVVNRTTIDHDHKGIPPVIRLLHSLS